MLVLDTVSTCCWWEGYSPWELPHSISYVDAQQQIGGECLDKDTGVFKTKIKIFIKLMILSENSRTEKLPEIHILLLVET